MVRLSSSGSSAEADTCGYSDSQNIPCLEQAETRDVGAPGAHASAVGKTNDRHAETVESVVASVATAAKQKGLNDEGNSLHQQTSSSVGFCKESAATAARDAVVVDTQAIAAAAPDAIWGRVIHKRCYGRKLAFVDFLGFRGVGPQDSEIMERQAGRQLLLETMDREILEGVFDQQKFHGNVRAVFKDISMGDVVRVFGRQQPPRPQDRLFIFEATDYKMLSRWSEEGDGTPFDASAFEVKGPTPPPLPVREGGCGEASRDGDEAGGFVGEGGGGGRGGYAHGERGGERVMISTAGPGLPSSAEKSRTPAGGTSTPMAPRAPHSPSTTTRAVLPAEASSSLGSGIAEDGRQQRRWLEPPITTGAPSYPVPEGLTQERQQRRREDVDEQGRGAEADHPHEEDGPFGSQTAPHLSTTRTSPPLTPEEEASLLLGYDPAKLCKFLLCHDECRRYACPYTHPSDPEMLRTARVAYFAWVRRRRALAAQLKGDPHAVDDKKAPHSKRAAVFASWLLETFGEETLRSGIGVVDIAGGRGDLAFELTVRRGIPCTVVDPRLPLGEPGKPSPCTSWQLSRAQHRFVSTILSGTSSQQTMEYARCVDHIAKCPLYQVGTMLPEDEKAWTTEETARWASLFKSAGLVVGMHPDQATGALVRAAVRFCRPFAVVPCCVFGDDFPERRLPARTLPHDIDDVSVAEAASGLAKGSAGDVSGTAGGEGQTRSEADRPVQSYEDLIEWLKLQVTEGNCKEAWLNFLGKNKVLFCQGKP